jgi:hypothetical protein
MTGAGIIWYLKEKNLCAFLTKSKGTGKSGVHENVV